MQSWFRGEFQLYTINFTDPLGRIQLQPDRLFGFVLHSLITLGRFFQSSKYNVKLYEASMGAVVKEGPWRKKKILTISNKKYILQMRKKYTSFDIWLLFMKTWVAVWQRGRGRLNRRWGTANASNNLNWTQVTHLQGLVKELRDRVLGLQVALNCSHPWIAPFEGQCRSCC